MLASYEEYLQDGGHPRGNNNQAKGLQDTPVDHTINPVRSIGVLLKIMNIQVSPVILPKFVFMFY